MKSRNQKKKNEKKTSIVLPRSLPPPPLHGGFFVCLFVCSPVGRPKKFRFVRAPSQLSSAFFSSRPPSHRPLPLVISVISMRPECGQLLPPHEGGGHGGHGSATENSCFSLSGLSLTQLWLFPPTGGGGGGGGESGGSGGFGGYSGGGSSSGGSGGDCKCTDGNGWGLCWWQVCRSVCGGDPRWLFNPSSTLPLLSSSSFLISSCVAVLLLPTRCRAPRQINK